MTVHASEPGNNFPAMLKAVQEAGEDFEWYPTTDRMIEVVARHLDKTAASVMDIGAGDGRVLRRLGAKFEHPPSLYAIEKSAVLIQAQPEEVVPVGTDLFEQNLTCLPVDYIFCNPPYSQFETWATLIIETGHARKAFLVIPRRWKDSAVIADALSRRKATVRVIHSDDFENADRRARAVVDIVEVSYPMNTRGYRNNELQDPFDVWFDQNISTFDEEPEGREQSDYERERTELARIRRYATIPEMVDGYNEEYARMQDNYRAIFQLDYALLKELGVNKNAVRDGIKVKMAGLKTRYWTLLFERLDSITARLSAATQKKFLERLTGRTAVAFTTNNAYAVVLWAIKNANGYFNEQTIKLFRDLSAFDGVMNYKSNARTWDKYGWRHRAEEFSHYALDYRFVVQQYQAITGPDSWDTYNNPGNLAKQCHNLIGDTVAVLGNLGFRAVGAASRDRVWTSNTWEDWNHAGTTDVLFQVKAFKNGNLHFRFMPDAMKALNVEAGRLLGWLHGPRDVETELGYSAKDAKRFFSSLRMIEPSSVRMLEGQTVAEEETPATEPVAQESLF